MTQEDKIAADLRTVISRLIKLLRKEIKGQELLSLTERSTLSIIYQHSGILPSELAAMEKVTSQSMSQIINKLSANDYIKKNSSDKDKRKVILTITAKGKKVIDRKRSDMQEWLAKSINEKTTQKEKETLVSAIGILTKLVD